MRRSGFLNFLKNKGCSGDTPSPLALRREGISLVSYLLVLISSIALTACSSDRIARYAPPTALKPAPFVQYGASAGFGGAGAHTVLPGDTVYMIAKQYKLPLRDIIDANNLTPPYKLAKGTRLQLPPPNTYKVKMGDSLPVVSRIFSVSQTDIIAMNDISAPYRLRIGQDLRLPRAQRVALAAVRSMPLLQPPGKIIYRPYPKNDPTLVQSAPVSNAPEAVVVERLPDVSVAPPPIVVTSNDYRPPAAARSAQQQAVFRGAPNIPARAGHFMQPVSGQVISRYGAKADGLYNEGINIAAPRGTPVRVAENGVVVYSGNGVEGYGNLILVKHTDGFITTYAHLEKLLTREGAKVTRGQTIGTVGSSGNVNRAQLHFEVRKGRNSVNPQTMI